MIEGNCHQLEFAGTLFPVKGIRYNVENAKYFEKEAEQLMKRAASALV